MVLSGAGRRSALLTPEGGLMAGRLFPHRPKISEAFEWERLLATHVRSGGDCLIIEEDSEIRELLAGISPRSHLQPPTSPRAWIQAQALHWRGSRLQVFSQDGTPRTAHLPLVGGSNLLALDLALNRVIHAGCCPTRTLATLPSLDPPTGLLEPVHAGLEAALPIVLAGKGGGSLKTGRLLDYLAAGDDNRKVCSLHLSLMDRMGVKLDRFGDASTRLAGL